MVVLFCVCVTLVPVSGFERDAIAAATAPYRFSVPVWELDHLPDKWVRRLFRAPATLAGGSGHEQRMTEVHEFFAVSRSLWSVEQQLLEIQARTPVTAEVTTSVDALLERRGRLLERRDDLRPPVEETLETTIAATLESLGFRAWTGPFPPVDTVLSASPTILVTSPRDRIERQDTVTMRPGLANEDRDRIETWVEDETELSALVLDTGGIALYPSIVVPHAGLDFALEVIAHEWVHQWLWFRPLGRRYFQGGDITAMNETVADIAGKEILELTRRRMAQMTPQSPETGEHTHSPLETLPAPDASAFSFQHEMRVTRIRVDELLAAGSVEEAEAYMEERRREFVANGYRLRRLNQAYFAFHGAYATTGAAGVNVIGQRIEELRRRSPNLGDFLRTAAEFRSVADLEAYLAATDP